jgi:hypothetical protein
MRRGYICLLILLALLVTLPAMAAETADVTVTADPDWVSISNSPGGLSLGAVDASSTHWANGTAPSFPLDDSNCTYTLVNDGSPTIDVDIAGANLTGAGGYQWTLGNSTGANQYVVRVGIAGTDSLGNMTILDLPGQEMISDLTTGNYTRWEMVLYAPSSFTSDAAVSGTITLTAREAS